MAEIILTFNTTAAWDVKLDKVLARVNAGRVAAEEEEFATIEAYLRFVLINAVKSYVARQDEVDHADRKAAFEAATENVQNQIDAALGLT